MITRLLVANRGEIARRVLRTCRDLGVETVAVYSDADASSPHAAEADHAVRLPGDRPADTYLDAAAIVAAARAAGADAVHPGYGFLSENAAFARAVLDAGLTWVGPSPAAIAAMGSKVEAKRLMAAAGVPVLATIAWDAAGPAAPASPDGLMFPVLVKASAGGGGRGMRVVRDAAELGPAVETARREALAAFGDGTVFAEPLLEDARHVEVQVLADAHGTVWTLGERECSIQRRHQKVLEETPSPGVTAATREALCRAAVRAAAAIGYVGAGTVEFLVKGDTVAFLEMNTRLQVEHPVTECVFGLDLVRLQLEIAEGARLPAEPPAPSGHAIEVRLYAEDPALDWRPQNGTLHRFEVPGVDDRFGAPEPGALRGGYGLRLDSGVESGSEIGVHYDPMLAKVVAWGPDRAGTARRLASALARARVHGVTTNRDLLVAVLRHPEFLAGGTDTGFLGRHDLTAEMGGPAAAVSALAAAVAVAAANREAATVLGGLPSGWRNVPSEPRRTAFQGPGGRVEVAYRFTRDGLVAEGFDGVRLVSGGPGEVVLEVDGVTRRFAVARYGDLLHVDSPLGSVGLELLPRLPEPVVAVAPGSLLAPMPGTVLRVDVTPGAAVAAGQPILTLEAMKMEHQISAPAAGVVSALNVGPGRQVEAGAVLAVIEEQG
ncbi:biotin carboxylase N-terminal domain-containing protein [Sphaerisporangium sp. TRM90804]|uniref:acetyl/propionyl/methylcrotonyl-CoA carboxylase subunit alpha n=1 Tax=Sphaerisporangium sp. TRM90804 TaxID=3031113 RepID=UPI00244CCA82|nr:biotin carboxylase N-terminal domain-containing protein [Sphaerisporangium sp. TRM90804]MDH2424070.1 biotin carboxylase N-terminal domain-containing protein [Sphaerisporangium sp. TRM90804]